jgi:hypothetical protein
MNTIHDLLTAHGIDSATWDELVPVLQSPAVQVGGAPTLNAEDATLALLEGDEPAHSSPEGYLSQRDRYRDLGLRGQGGMGEVRLVRDRRLHRSVALKAIRAENPTEAMYERFVQEVQV